MGLVGPRLGLALILCCLSISASVAVTNLPPPCDRTIYCYGRLLHTVQMAEVFEDSKHFVDMVMKTGPEEIEDAFQTLMDQTKENPSKAQVTEFVEKYFEEPESAFIAWNPKDWKPDPPFLDKIKSPKLKSLGEYLHQTWKELGRQISVDVKNHPERYSLIYVNKPVIVPGGRFKEFYYWDSFWTIEGLLLSNMTKTVRGMLSNFLQMVDKFGMVPNGGRVYYERRSQPPYLIPMVKTYVDHTGDVDFLRQEIPLLEAEYLFWEENRMQTIRDTHGVDHRVASYNVQVGGPRPESYREDFSLAEDLVGAAEKQKLYVELKSGAESGWDYSSRWFVPEDPTDEIGSLSDIKITSIAPVDLNSLLCYNAKTLAEFYTKLGHTQKVAEYEKVVAEKIKTMEALFWDDEDGVWHDFNLDTLEKKRSFYLSNLHPLWAGCYGSEKHSKEETVAHVINYIKDQAILDYVGGVPTSLKDSGEQWDFPNAWAPIQHLIIMGLYKSRDLHEEAEDIAFELAQKWIRTNYAGFVETGGMFEKYDVTVVGHPGGGGEYEVVLGFGWTNGLDIQLLNTFGDRLSAEATSDDGTTAGAITNSIGSRIFVASLSFWGLYYLYLG